MYYTIVCLGHFVDTFSHTAILPYPTATVKQYSPLTLKCSYDEYIGSRDYTLWEWISDGVNIVSLVSREVGTCSPFHGTLNHSIYLYDCGSNWTTLTVRSVTEERHNERWSCMVTMESLVKGSGNTSIFVEVPVKHVNFSSPAGATAIVTENVPTQFICSTSMERPRSTIRWYMTGSTDSIGTGTLRYYNNTTTSTFSYTFNRSMNARDLYCTAVNIYGENPVESIHKVILVRYGTDSGPMIEGFSNGSSLSVIDSTQQSLTCYVRGGNPLPTLKWDCFSGTVYNVTRQEDEIRSTITWTASRYWASSTCSCISHQLVSGQQVYRLMVNLLYPPSKPAFRIGSTLVNGTLSIIRGAHVTVICEASSSPSPYYEWTKTSVITSGQKLYLGNTQVADEGTYSCTARNTMKPSMGKEESGNNSSPFVLDVLYGTDSGPMIEGFSNGSSLSVIDSTQQSLTCYVRGGNPLPTLKWDCFSGTVYNVTRQEDEIRSTITWTASRYWASSTCSCISHQLVSGQQVYRLMVNLLYPPSKPAFRIGSTLVNGTLSIIRGAHVTVTCEASSSPSPYYEWTKTSVITSGQKLYLGNTQVADEGTYSCTARNTMKPSMGKEESGNNSSPFVLDVLYPPEAPTFKVGTQSLTANLSVVRGDNVKVACDSTSDPGPEFRWTGQQPGISQLTITSIQVATTKNCTVTNTMFPTVGPFETGYAYASLHIIVMSEPTIPGLSYFSTISSNVQLSASDLVVIRGTSFSVLCLGSTSIPGPPSYEWKGLSTRLSASNNLSFTDIGNQDSGIYTCTVTNTMNRTVGATEPGQSSKHLVVEVHYPPVIHPLEDQFIDENEPLYLSCIASSNPPPISYIWTRSKDTFVQQSSTLTIEHAKREDSDAYTCTVCNQMFPTVAEGETNGTESYTVNLKVLYHPDVTLTQINGTVTEGDVNVMLLCAAEGEPQNYTFAKWVHFAPDGTTKIKEYTSTLINNGDAYLIFRTISYMDSGRYQCSVSNGISDYRTGNSFVTSNTDQIVKAKPVIIQTHQTAVSSLHENVSLWTTYYSNDGSTPTTVWYRIRDEIKTVLNQTNKIISADEAFAVSVPFYAVTIAQPGHRAKLFINDVMESDFGDYEVVVTNSVGKTTSRIRLAVHVEGQTERTAEDSKKGVTAGILGGLVGVVVGAVFGALVMFRCRSAIKAKCQRSSSSNRKQEQYYMNAQVITPENMSKEANENNSPNILDENTYEGLDSRRKQDATYESLQLENRKVNKDGPDVYYNLSLQA